jgi:hypothetical protein
VFSWASDSTVNTLGGQGPDASISRVETRSVHTVSLNAYVNVLRTPIRVQCFLTELSITNAMLTHSITLARPVQII